MKIKKKHDHFNKCKKNILQNSTPTQTRSSNTIRIVGKFLSLGNDIHKNLTVNTELNREGLNDFS